MISSHPPVSGSEVVKILKSRELLQPAPIHFQVQTLNLNFAGKHQPALKRYILEVLDDSKDNFFTGRNTIRTSELARYVDIEKPKARAIKDSPVCKMAALAEELAKTRKERHDAVANFFLANDAATVATELPVYVTKEESCQDETVTGHIDIVQVRQGKLYLLDYKPEPDPYAGVQLTIHARLLKRRTGIKEMICAYFDSKTYRQFRPDI